MSKRWPGATDERVLPGLRRDELQPHGSSVPTTLGPSARAGVLGTAHAAWIMFIRYYLDLEIPFGDVEPALTSAPGEWVPGLARDAGDRAERLLTEVGFSIAAGRIDKQVEIGFDQPFRLPQKTLLPMWWRATAAEQLFPPLEADIEVAALGPNRTQLSISARYRPPMGAVGRVLDRTLLYHVAEATVKDFLDRVGENLSARVLASR